MELKLKDEVWKLKEEAWNSTKESWKFKLGFRNGAQILWQNTESLLININFSFEVSSIAIHNVASIKSIKRGRLEVDGDSMNIEQYQDWNASTSDAIGH